jgi:hypothetical protein
LDQAGGSAGPPKVLSPLSLCQRNPNSCHSWRDLLGLQYGWGGEDKKFTLLQRPIFLWPVSSQESLFLSV